MAKKNIKDDIEKILISGDEIEEIVGRISANVDDYYRDRDSRLLLLGILKGSVVFMGELMKKITVPVEIDFMKVSSYGGGTSSSGSINIILDLYRKDLSNTDILIVEPNVHEHPVFKLTDYKSAYTRADIVAFLVSHKEFKTLPHNEEKVILDFCGVFKKL